MHMDPNITLDFTEDRWDKQFEDTTESWDH